MSMLDTPTKDILDRESTLTCKDGGHHGRRSWPSSISSIINFLLRWMSPGPSRRQGGSLEELDEEFETFLDYVEGAS